MELGTAALAVSVGLFATTAATAAVAPRRRIASVFGEWAPSGRGVMVAAITAVWVAWAVLAWATLQVDGRFVEVAETTSRPTTSLYRFAGLWGGPRSSYLTFIAVLCLCLLPLLRDLTQGALIVCAMSIGALTILSAQVADPFRRLDVPAIDGRGLNPILRHPAMLVHPPLLYAGLALMCVAAVAAAIGDRSARRLLVGAWLLLGVALALGAWWSSTELGWGGVWAWDQVENAGLVPWLLATAALHHGLPRRSTAPVDRVGTALVLGAAWFAFADNALTRSGAGFSIHAFSDANSLGRWLGVLLVAGAVVAVVAVLRAPGGPARSVNRGVERSAVATGAAVAAAVVVVLGTCAPLFSQAFGGGRVSIRGTFFARSLVPIVVVGLLGMSAAAGKAGRVMAAAVAIAGGVAVPLMVAGGLRPGPAVLVAIGIGAGVCVAISERGPARVAHLGFIIMLVGLVVSGTGRSASFGIEPGEAVRVDGFTIRYLGLEVRDAAERRVFATPVVVTRGSREVARLSPSIDRWAGVAAPLVEPAAGSWRGIDVQVVPRRIIRNPAEAPRSAVLFEVHVRPLLRLVWLGALTMAVGAGWTLARAMARSRSTRRRDAGAPDRRVQPYDESPSELPSVFAPSDASRSGSSIEDAAAALLAESNRPTVELL